MANANQQAKDRPGRDQRAADKPTSQDQERPSADAGQATTTALAPRQNGAVSTQIGEVDFSSDAGRGMEGATQESFAIPFLTVLQKGSPQVDEASGQAIEGAKQGMFYENVTGKMFDGKKGVLIVPCAYRRVYLRWGPKSGAGSGFKGELLPEEVLKLRTEGKLVEVNNKLFFPKDDGFIHPEECDRVADVRNHYVLLIDEATGTWTQALLSLASTQIKKSKMLMSALASVKLTGNAGVYTPASWANKVRATTVPEQNEKGSWMGISFKLEGLVNRADLYQAGKAFNASVRSGSVEVKYEDPEDHTTVDAGPPAGGGEPGSAGGRF